MEENKETGSKPGNRIGHLVDLICRYRNEEKEKEPDGIVRVCFEAKKKEQTRFLPTQKKNNQNQKLMNHLPLKIEENQRKAVGQRNQ